MASSSVIVESLSSTMFIPLATSLVATAFTHDHVTSTVPYGVAWVLVVALACTALLYLRHAQPATATAT